MFLAFNIHSFWEVGEKDSQAVSFFIVRYMFNNIWTAHLNLVKDTSFGELRLPFVVIFVLVVVIQVSQISGYKIR